MDFAQPRVSRMLETVFRPKSVDLVLPSIGGKEEKKEEEGLRRPDQVTLIG